MKQQICVAGMMLAGLALPAEAREAQNFFLEQGPAVPAPPPGPRTHVAVTMRHAGGFLGVGVEEIDHERAQALGLREEHGVEVKSIEEGSPAAQAGLRVGDVVLDYNGQRVEGVEQFTRMVGETPAGRRCALGIWRNHGGQTLTATLAPRTLPGFDERRMRDLETRLKDLPPMPAMPDMPMTPRPTMGWRMGMLGIEGEELNPQLAEYFGVKEGVLVRAVVRDSAAEHAGLKAGDVITRVDGTAVTSPREITSLMRASRGKPSSAVTLVRSRKEMTLEVRQRERFEGREAPRAPEPPR